jgi:peptidoglycan/LPS O-acetylase OafA/YrhL
MNFLEPSLPGLFAGNRNHAVNGSLWTIKLEVGFYMAAPLLAYILRALKSKKNMNIFLACLYVFGFVYNFVCLYISRKTGNMFIGKMAHQLPGFIQSFAVGIFCAINYDFVRRHDKYLILPGAAMAVLYYITGNQYLLPVGLGIIIMFVGFNFSCLNGIGKMSDYSYGAYLFHFPVIQILTALGYFKLNKNAALLIVLGTVFSIAYLSWNFLEKRVLKRP